MYVPYDETDPDSAAPNNYDEANNKLEVDLASRSNKIEKLISKSSSYQKSLASSENQKTKAKMNAIKQKIKLNRKEKILKAKLSSLEKTLPSVASTVVEGVPEINAKIQSHTSHDQSLKEENEESFNENAADAAVVTCKPIIPTPPSTKPNQNLKLENLNNIRLKRYHMKAEEKADANKDVSMPDAATTSNENLQKEAENNSDEENCYNNEYLTGDDYEDGYDDDEEDDEDDEEDDEEYEEEDEEDDEEDQYVDDEYDDEDEDNENEYDEDDDQEEDDEEDEEVRF